MVIDFIAVADLMNRASKMCKLNVLVDNFEAALAIYIPDLSTGR